MKKLSCWSIICAACMLVSGCSEFADDADFGVDEVYSVRKVPLTAQCSIAVEGFGTVEMETDYVPNVTWCENGNAPTQALNAQACAARTFAYYKISKGNTPVKNSQSDQVYSCVSRAPTTEQLDRCKAAANTTAGRVLTYKNTITAGFFVSGSKGACLDAECNYIGKDTDACYVSQQKYVTYNWGKSGTKDDGFTQSSIGYISDKNYANRGCMSQNGASCLARNNWGWENILKYFYGADINIELADGRCVQAKACETTLSASGTIIDDDDPCFMRKSTESWYEVDGGYGGHLYYTYVWDKAADTTGTWTVNVTRPGKYEVFAYIQGGVGAVSAQAPYTIRASGKETSVSIDLTGKSGWVSLGSYVFASGGDQWVRLTDASGEKYTDKSGKRVLFDAIKFEDAVDCEDACSAGDMQCSEGGLQTCSLGSHGCLAWSSPVSCGAGKTCSGKACVESCSDACVRGEVQCSEGGVQTCVVGASGCFEWSAPVACDTGLVCRAGRCSDDCTDECAQNGIRKCAENGYVICGQYDGDSCLEWSSVQACGSGETCTNGACDAAPCEDECAAGDVVCENGELIRCGQYDNDLCLEYRREKCGQNEVCRDGACIADPGCEDECTAYSTRCIGENSYISCGHADGEICFKWDTNATRCGAEEICMDGHCSKRDNVWDGEVSAMPKGCLTSIDGRPSTIIDDQDPCFVREYSTNWSQLSSYGHGGHLYYAYVTDGFPSAVGTWYLNVKKSGKYTIYVYIEQGIGRVSRHAPYTVKASGVEHLYGIDLNEKSGWFKIGDYDLTAGAEQYVLLTDSTGEKDDITNRRRLVFDAIQVVPYGTEITGKPEAGAGTGDGTGSEDGTGSDDPGSEPETKPSLHKSSGCSMTTVPEGEGAMAVFALICAGLLCLRRREWVKNRG